ncbi:hypothetical protein BABINDRAFT_160227, partial [Babjeviella inositovora NRRL Y-12698]
MSQAGSDGVKTSWGWFAKEKPRRSSFCPPSTPSLFPPKERLVSGCQCCGTVVSYPFDAHKYRCLSCETTNRVQAEPELSPSHPEIISYALLQRCIEECTQKLGETPAETFKPLEAFVTRQFASYRHIHDSFRQTQGKIHHHDPNIMRMEVRQYFHLLTRLPTRRPLLKALTAVLELLKRPPHLQDTQYLRCLLVFMEIPFLAHGLIHSDFHGRKPVSMLDTIDVRSLSYDIAKRVFGLLAHVNEGLLRYLVPWLRNTPDTAFLKTVELVNLYLTFQLNRQLLKVVVNPTKERSEYAEYSAAKSEARPNSLSIALPLAFGLFPKKPKDDARRLKLSHYTNDWRVATAAKVLMFLFMANGTKALKCNSSIFYNSLVDYVNLKQDFDGWQQCRRNRSVSINNNLNISVPVVSDVESVMSYLHSSICGGLAVTATRTNFAFCQFPFLISLGGKISILEYEARRTMEQKAEEAFINSLDKKMVFDVHFRVRVRRTHIVPDSLRCIQDNRANFKKGLRIEFVGEPGIDVGGLRKEWFLLLSRDLFNADNGMFTMSQESNLLWFSLAPLENDEMYYLFGVVLGLAIYNSTILDLSVFPFALFRALLGKPLDLEDYSELYPETANGLRHLLSYDGNVEDLSLTFEATYRDVFGSVQTRELVPKGGDISVTSENRVEYVDRYVDFFLMQGLLEQFRPFKKGFDNVTGGNALSLFTAHEIQLLLCGSSEGSLDVKILRSVSKYAGWGSVERAEEANIVVWFWDYFEEMPYREQKLLLRFVTGSDRVPATGVHTMNFKVVKLSGHHERLPIAHTCFNELCLYEYRSKEVLQQKLSVAINESSGFGL